MKPQVYLITRGKTADDTVIQRIFTGVVVASLFKDMEDNKWLIYGLGFTSSILALIAGLVLTNKKKEDK